MRSADKFWFIEGAVAAVVIGTVSAFADVPSGMSTLVTVVILTMLSPYVCMYLMHATAYLRPAFGVILHLATAVIGFHKGLFWGIGSLLLPYFSEVYWSYNISKAHGTVLNPYVLCVAAYAFLVVYQFTSLYTVSLMVRDAERSTRVAESQGPTKPRIVSVAIRLLYVALYTGIVRLVTDGQFLRRLLDVPLLFVLPLGLFLIMAALYRQISKRRNWARVVLLALVAIPVPFAVLDLIQRPPGITLSAALELAQASLNIAALVLLFLPTANSWFSTKHPHQPASAPDNDSEAWHNLGVAYAGQGKYDDAVTAYRKAIKLQPVFPRAWYSLGLVFALQDKHDDAVAAYREAIKQEQDEPFAWFSLGMAYEDLLSPLYLRSPPVRSLPAVLQASGSRDAASLALVLRASEIRGHASPAPVLRVLGLMALVCCLLRSLIIADSRATDNAGSRCPSGVRMP